jgi:hypothetical protein
MAKTIETIATINSAVRTTLAVIVCGAVGTGSFVAYQKFNAHEIAAREASEKLAKMSQEFEQAQTEIAAQKTQIQEQAVTIDLNNKKIAKLETVLAWLKIDHRLARLDIVDQTIDDESKVTSLVEFVELNPEGEPLGKPRRFTLSGDMIYIDGQVVKFEDKYVESNEVDRSMALFVFKRIFTDRQNPKDGFPLDEVGTQPLTYVRGGQPSELAKKIWSDFWSISNNEERAHELGIRAAHGLAVSIQPKKNMSYRLELRANGDITIRDQKPLSDAAKVE